MKFPKSFAVSLAISIVLMFLFFPRWDEHSVTLTPNGKIEQTSLSNESAPIWNPPSSTIYDASYNSSGPFYSFRFAVVPTATMALCFGLVGWGIISAFRAVFIRREKIGSSAPKVNTSIPSPRPARRTSPLPPYNPGWKIVLFQICAGIGVAIIGAMIAECFDSSAVASSFPNYAGKLIGTALTLTFFSCAIAILLPRRARFWTSLGVMAVMTIGISIWSASQPPAFDPDAYLRENGVTASASPATNVFDQFDPKPQGSH